MDSRDYIEQIRKLQAELDIVTKECNEWKEKFERLLMYQKQNRLPVSGLPITNKIVKVNLDCVGSSQGKASTQTYTTVGWNEGEDWK